MRHFVDAPRPLSSSSFLSFFPFRAVGSPKTRPDLYEPPQAQTPRGDQQEMLMHQKPFMGNWRRLPRPRDPSQEAAFRGLRTRCMLAAAEERHDQHTSRLPIPLDTLARHAGVEPADCAGCAKPECALCDEMAPGDANDANGLICCNTLLSEMLARVGNWLEKASVKHFMLGGTLLGAMQDGQVHQWKEGAVLAVDADALLKVRELDPELLKYGLSYFVNQDHEGSLLNPDGEGKGWLVPKGEICLTGDVTVGGPELPSELKPGSDFYVLEGKETRMYTNLKEVPARDYEPWVGDEITQRRFPHVALLPYYEENEEIHIVGALPCHRRFLRDKMFPLSTVGMGGHDWPAPRFAHEALTQMFGPNYLDKKRFRLRDDRTHVAFCQEQGL